MKHMETESKSLSKYFEIWIGLYLSIFQYVLTPRGTSDGYSGIPSAEGVSWKKVIEKLVWWVCTVQEGVLV